MSDTLLAFLAGLTGPQFAFVGLFVAGVFAAGVGLGVSLATSLPRRRRGLHIAAHRRF